MCRLDSIDLVTADPASQSARCIFMLAERWVCFITDKPSSCRSRESTAVTLTFSFSAPISDHSLFGLVYILYRYHRDSCLLGPFFSSEDQSHLVRADFDNPSLFLLDKTRKDELVVRGIFDIQLYWGRFERRRPLINGGYAHRGFR